MYKRFFFFLVKYICIKDDASSSKQSYTCVNQPQIRGTNIARNHFSKKVDLSFQRYMSHPDIIYVPVRIYGIVKKTV